MAPRSPREVGSSWGALQPPPPAGLELPALPAGGVGGDAWPHGSGRGCTRSLASPIPSAGDVQLMSEGSGSSGVAGWGQSAVWAVFFSHSSTLKLVLSK